MALPALLLPGIGDVIVFYTPPLVVARLLNAFVNQEQLSARELWPYVAAFAGLWLAGGRMADRRAVYRAGNEFEESKRSMWRPWMSCWQRISHFFRTIMPDR